MCPINYVICIKQGSFVCQIKYTIRRNLVCYLEDSGCHLTLLEVAAALLPALLRSSWQTCTFLSRYIERETETETQDLAMASQCRTGCSRPMLPALSLSVTSFIGAQLWRLQCHSLNTNQQLLKLHPPEQSRTVTALSCILCFAPLRALQPSPARQLEAAVEPRVLSAGCWDHGAQRIPPGCSCSCREHVLRSAEQHTAELAHVLLMLGAT